MWIPISGNWPTLAGQSMLVGGSCEVGGAVGRALCLHTCLLLSKQDRKSLFPSGYWGPLPGLTKCMGLGLGKQRLELPTFMGPLPNSLHLQSFFKVLFNKHLA